MIPEVHRKWYLSLWCYFPLICSFTFCDMWRVFPDHITIIWWPLSLSLSLSLVRYSAKYFLSRIPEIVLLNKNQILTINFYQKTTRFVISMFIDGHTGHVCNSYPNMTPRFNRTINCWSDSRVISSSWWFPYGNEGLIWIIDIKDDVLTCRTKRKHWRGFVWIRER